jgi:hypothetical protein
MPVFVSFVKITDTPIPHTTNTHQNATTLQGVIETIRKIYGSKKKMNEEVGK